MKIYITVCLVARYSDWTVSGGKEYGMEWTMAPSGMAEAAGTVIAGLHAGGREAYFVGGCLRDELLGRPVHDMDITTSALPEEVMAIFPRCVPTGLVHGTVTVLQDGYSF